ncbi:hypothetical protein MPSEU_000491600 [Mayamaea pseudoterrestris]|nr:hypothetical protein MPSEU_000491600 [Mayamaea pseudoterrestris]
MYGGYGQLQQPGPPPPPEHQNHQSNSSAYPYSSSRALQYQQQRGHPSYSSNTMSGQHGYQAYPPFQPHQQHRLNGPPLPVHYDNMSYQPQQQAPQAFHYNGAHQGNSTFYRSFHQQQSSSSRSSSDTPASHMSAITFDYVPPGLQFPRHSTPAPFDSRTPSPDIPVPPNFLKNVASAHSKLPNPMATRIGDANNAPLRESQRFNVNEGLEENTNMFRGRNNKMSITVETGTSEPTPSLLAVNESTKDKPAVLVSDATLLLGLRTLSPAGTCASHDTGSLTLDLNGDHNTVATDNSTIATVESSFQKSIESATPQTQQALPLTIPKDYPRRLALDGDETQLNSLHCYIRRSLLEIFVVKRKTNVADVTPTTNSSAGRVGLRCVFCAMARQNDPNGKNEAPMAVFYPRTVNEIYRLVTSWQRCHLRKCRNLPPSIRAEWNSVREAEKCRGKTSYWVDSAREIGLVDCVSKAGGIHFCLPRANDDPRDVEPFVL